MTRLCLSGWVGIGLLLPVALQVEACNSPAVQTVSVSLSNSEVYQYPTVGGDEEGATISSQAGHFRISEIRRDASTNFVAVYVYQAATGYVGSDSAEIRITSSADGTDRKSTRLNSSH